MGECGAGIALVRTVTLRGELERRVGPLALDEFEGLRQRHRLLVPIPPGQWVVDMDDERGGGMEAAYHRLGQGRRVVGEHRVPALGVAPDVDQRGVKQLAVEEVPDDEVVGRAR